MKIHGREMLLSDFFAAKGELLAQLDQGSEPLVLIENGAPVAVLENVADYKEKSETLALLRLLAMAKEDIAAGRVHPIEGLLDRIFERAEKQRQS